MKLRLTTASSRLAANASLRAQCYLARLAVSLTLILALTLTLIAARRNVSYVMHLEQRDTSN